VTLYHKNELTVKESCVMMGTGITAEPHKAMGQDTALRVDIKFLDNIIGQTFGGGIGREGGPKGFEMLSDDRVENGLTGVSRLVGRRYHMPAFRRQ
jgi:hypothetical protein